MTPGGRSPGGDSWDEHAWDDEGDGARDDGADGDVGRWDESVRDEGRAPICPHCGVTALPADTANVLDATFVCDNADCDAFGQPV